MNQAFQLYRLQQIDNQLLQISSRLVEIQKILTDDSSRKEAYNRAMEAKRRLDSEKGKLRQKEFEAQTIKINIETNEASLYSGKIQNPKELQDLQNDITYLRRRFVSQEDELLELMLRIEELEGEYQNAVINENNTLNGFTTLQDSLLSEKSRLILDQEKTKVEREAISSSILLENYEIYSRLLQQKRGLAVVTIKDDNCTGCGATIRPSERQAAKNPQQIGFCSSCGRILYSG